MTQVKKQLLWLLETHYSVCYKLIAKAYMKAKLQGLCKYWIRKTVQQTSTVRTQKVRNVRGLCYKPIN